MNPTIADEIIKICAQRSREGDRPSIPPATVEQLEGCVIELAAQLHLLKADKPSIEAYKLFRKERKLREIAEAKLSAAVPNGESR